MKVSQVNIYTSGGDFVFEFNLDGDDFKFNLHKSEQSGNATIYIQGKDGNGRIVNKESCEVKLQGEFLDLLLAIVDEWLQFQKDAINEELMSEISVMTNSIKELEKGINNTKKNYYDIIKSNKAGAKHNRPLSSPWHSVDPQRKKELINKERREKRAAKRPKVDKVVPVPRKKLFNWD